MARGLITRLLGHAHAVARSFPHRLREPHFWYIQALIAGITVFHVLTETPQYAERLAIFYYIPVTLYIVPIVYASLLYGWEGGLLTGLWAGLLSTPNMVLWHRHGAMWAGDALKLAVVIAVGTLMSWRVAAEGRLRRKSEATSRELAISEARYRSLFENAGDAIIVCDGSGQIVSANPAASALTGYSLPQLLGMPVSYLLRREDPAPSAEEATEPCVAAAGNGPVAFLLHTRGGNDVPVEAVPAQLPDGDGGLLTQTVIRDVTAHKNRETSLHSFIQQITRAQEEERGRIALELHDETVQAIALIRRELQEVVRLPGLETEAAARVGRAHELAGEAVEGVRRFSRALRPPMLDDLGLVPALEAMITEMGERTGAEVKLQVTAAPRRLSREVELVLFRIAQEALRNVEKHSQATRVLTTLEFQGGLVRMSVADNGKGFHMPTVSGHGLSNGQLGLIGMRERASLLGAEFDVQSAPGAGTRLSVTYRQEGTENPRPLTT